MYFEVTPRIDSNFAFQLWKYEKELQASDDTLKPVITVSREFGCESFPLANKLAHRLTTEKHKWVAFSKQMVSQDADAAQIRRRILEELRMMKRNALEQTFEKFFANKPTNIGMFHDMVDEMKILAARGHAILIGGGGALLLREHTQALHVRLVGSLAFRQHRISRDYHLSDAEAAKMVADGSQTRDKFIHDYLRHDISDPHLYDIVIRNDKYSVEQMADIVLEAYRARFGAH